MSFIDDPKVLARASQVSERWRDLLSDDMTWKNLCVKHDYDRRLSEVDPRSPVEMKSDAFTPGNMDTEMTVSNSFPGSHPSYSGHPSGSRSFNAITERPKLRTYKSHFKQRYLVEAAWRSAGTSVHRNITQEGGVVTSLHLTPKYIIVALDNAKIHVFDTEGDSQRILQGHVMGVWAMVPWGDTMVSGGCDRDVRVWDLKTGYVDDAGHEKSHRKAYTCSVHVCIPSEGTPRLSGASKWRTKTPPFLDRETPHFESGTFGRGFAEMFSSGTSRVSDVSRSRGTLSFPVAMIPLLEYGAFRKAVAFRHCRATSVRFTPSPLTAKGSSRVAWTRTCGCGILRPGKPLHGVSSIIRSPCLLVCHTDDHDRECLAILQGHTSLVGQLQMRGDTLVTGGSDGSVRVWSLERMCPIHRLAAHDNSVTSLQFDDTRVVSGGSDGRVKIWDLKTGHLVRELIAQGEAVWRVAFEEEKCVALALRHGRTVMEVRSINIQLRGPHD